MLPTRVDFDPEAFFAEVPDGVHVIQPAWVSGMKLTPCPDPDEWSEPRQGMYYHPGRLSEGVNQKGVLELSRRCARKTPVRVTQAEGYISALFRTRDGYLLHLLAENYDVDIDHALDDIRTHRSRVNYVNKAEPVGITGTVRVASPRPPQVFTPFRAEGSAVTREGDEFAVTLPRGCAYAILRFQD